MTGRAGGGTAGRADQIGSVGGDVCHQVPPCIRVAPNCPVWLKLSPLHSYTSRKTNERGSFVRATRQASIETRYSQVSQRDGQTNDAFDQPVGRELGADPQSATEVALRVARGAYPWHS
jgi:hypothetical protein